MRSKSDPKPAWGLVWTEMCFAINKGISLKSFVEALLTRTLALQPAEKCKRSQKHFFELLFPLQQIFEVSICQRYSYVILFFWNARFHYSPSFFFFFLPQSTPPYFKRMLCLLWTDESSRSAVNVVGLKWPEFVQQRSQLGFPRGYHCNKGVLQKQ